jgi:membrane-associated phospholipid phosphatase
MKYFLYDLAGSNHEFFVLFNSYVNAPNHFLVEVASYLGSYLNFPIMFLLFAFFLIKSNLQSKLSRITIFTITVLSTMLMVGSFKAFFSYARPFCTDSLNLVFNKELAANVLCHQSFPSGHTAYTAALLFGSWASLPLLARVIGCFGLFIIMFSRIVAGMHFPADILWGLIIAYAAYVVAKKITNPLLDFVLKKISKEWHAKKQH